MDNFASKSARHLCAYVMWRLNWIHPFEDGNGRTSRAIAYYVFCAKAGYRLPGRETMPEQIAADKQPYYRALEAADKKDLAGQIDVSELESLLEDCLAKQLVSAFEDTNDPGVSVPDSRKFH